MTVIGITLPLWGWILIFLVVLYLVVGIAISILIFNDLFRTFGKKQRERLFDTKWKIITDFVSITIFWLPKLKNRKGT